MTEISERYRRLSEAFTAKVESVPADRWDSPSPCEGWTARDVVGHVVDTHGMFLGLVGRELGEIPAAADDPVAAWQAARAVIQADLDDPARAGAEFDGFAGRTSFEQAVGRFLCFDQVVHGWDLARATGLDERIPSEDVAWVVAQTEAMGDNLRSPGVCGPAIEAPSDADEQTRMLLLLGRRP